MAALAWASRLVLAGVLLVAAATKLRDRAGMPARLHALAVPDEAVPAVTVGLPVVEVLVAVGLVAWPSSIVPVCVALGLLVLFSIIVATTLSRGVEVACACFGGASAEPISARTIVRNAWLIALGIVGTGSVAGASGLAVVAFTAILGALTILVLRAFG